MLFDTKYDSEILYTGKDYPDLEIRSGDSLAKVLEKVAEISEKASGLESKVNALEQKLANLKSSDIKNDADTLDVSATNVSKITNRTLKYSVSSEAGSNRVYYDASDFKLGLPAGTSIVNSRVTLVDANNRKSSAGGTTGSFPVPTMPAKLNVNLTVRDELGDASFQRSIPISGVTDREKAVSLQPTPLTFIDKSSTQGEVNESLSKELSTLRSFVDEIKSLDIVSKVQELESLMKK